MKDPFNLFILGLFLVSIVAGFWCYSVWTDVFKEHRELIDLQIKLEVIKQLDRAQ